MMVKQFLVKGRIKFSRYIELFCFCFNSSKGIINHETKIIIGNWKNYLNKDESVKLAKRFLMKKSME